MHIQTLCSCCLRKYNKLPYCSFTTRLFCCSSQTKKNNLLPVPLCFLYWSPLSRHDKASTHLLRHPFVWKEKYTCRAYVMSKASGLGEHHNTWSGSGTRARHVWLQPQVWHQWADCWQAERPHEVKDLSFTCQPIYMLKSETISKKDEWSLFSLIPQATWAPICLFEATVANADPFLRCGALGKSMACMASITAFE